MEDGVSLGSMLLTTDVAIFKDSYTPTPLKYYRKEFFWVIIMYFHFLNNFSYALNFSWLYKSLSWAISYLCLSIS